jgi:hypothetical protein
MQQATDVPEKLNAHFNEWQAMIEKQSGENLW